MAEKETPKSQDDQLKELIREKVAGGLDTQQATDVARAQLAHNVWLAKQAEKAAAEAAEKAAKEKSSPKS